MNYDTYSGRQGYLAEIICAVFPQVRGVLEQQDADILAAIRAEKRALPTALHSTGRTTDNPNRNNSYDGTHKRVHMTRRLGRR